MITRSELPTFTLQRLRPPVVNGALPTLREVSYLTSLTDDWMKHPHRHDGVEVIGCFSGRIQVQIGGEVSENGDGRTSVYVVPCGCLFAFDARYSHQVRVLSPPYGRWLLHIDAEGWLGAHLGSPVVVAPTGLDAQTRIAFQLAFQRLYGEIQARSGDKAAVAGRLTCLLRLVKRIAQTSKGQRRQPKASQAVSTVIGAVHRNLHSGISIRVLSHSVGYSAGHLQRMFRQEMGVSITQYVAIQRLEQAGRLLFGRWGRLRIRDVAQTLGFSDITYFSSYFRRHSGLSPTEYRMATLA